MKNFLKKNLVHLFAVWIMFSNGQIWKYPQAEGWVAGGSSNWMKKTFILTCDSGTQVVEIPQYKVKKIGFAMKEVYTQGYFVFHNPACVTEDDVTPVHSDDEEVIILKNGVRTERSSEGKTFMKAAHVVHFNDVKNDWE